MMMGHVLHYVQVTLTYIICIECDVTEGDTLEWTFQPLGNPVTFSPSDDVGEEIVRSPINITLTRKVLNTNDISYLPVTI